MHHHLYSAIATTTTIAYGYRYRAPTLNHYLTFTLFHHNHHHHHHPPPPPSPPTFSLCPHFPNANFVTGNSPFFRMEVTHFPNSCLDSEKTQENNISSINFCIWVFLGISFYVLYTRICIYFDVKVV